MEDINDFSKWDLMVENKEYIVFRYTEPCNEYMRDIGLTIVAANKVEIHDKSDTRKAGLIIHDLNLLKFDNDVQNFLINHEIGHISNGDLSDMTDKKSITLIIARCLGIIPSMEFKADTFAALVTSKKAAQKSLMKLVKSKSLPFITRKEFFIRWIALSLRPIKNS